MFQYRKRYGLHAIRIKDVDEVEEIPFQYRKRYGLHAMSTLPTLMAVSLSFQYRKRYGLHAIERHTLLPLVGRGCFNTASGMDCMQYGANLWDALGAGRFNTASGMDCMQLKQNASSPTFSLVSIPQAVWIACNTVSQNP